MRGGAARCRCGQAVNVDNVVRVLNPTVLGVVGSLDALPRWLVDVLVEPDASERRKKLRVHVRVREIACARTSALWDSVNLISVC